MTQENGSSQLPTFSEITLGILSTFHKLSTKEEWKATSLSFTTTNQTIVFCGWDFPDNLQSELQNKAKAFVSFFNSFLAVFIRGSD